MTEFLVIGLAIAILLVLWKSRRNYLALPELPGMQVDGAGDVTVMRTGVEGEQNASFREPPQVQTKWILFAEAATCFEPSFAISMVRYAEAENLQAVTAFLAQRGDSLKERIVLPSLFALYFFGISANKVATKVNNRGSPGAFLNGPCVLFERAAYESIAGDGHPTEDVVERERLAAEAKRLGVRVGGVRAEKLGQVPMRVTVSAIWGFLLANPLNGLRVLLASILLISWLPVLVLGARDLPVLSLRAILFSPLIALFIAPLVGLWPWYRHP